MNNNKKFLMLMFTVVVVILAACGKSSDESSARLETHSQNNNSTQNTSDDSSNEDSTENTLNTDNTDPDTINKENTDTNEEGSSTNSTEASLKKEYIEKLNDTKKETEELEATDSSTYALKKVENDRWDIWDELLNEIYVVLEGRLPSEEMDQLREEQRNWLEYRDDSALEASQKYKGGTQEHLEYVTVLANLTERRCHELVADYMK
ncbi:lysozyme inhibitor LprI family protein [Bacillus sp. 2205SS5-2]|uniref:lysozyme inhibitor LprI family protein n=1 Tax=Bacillus sp. 2205SS5-2 TaxID=3109031 RepID=UPI003007C4E2